MGDAASSGAVVQLSGSPRTGCALGYVETVKDEVTEVGDFFDPRALAQAPTTTAADAVKRVCRTCGLILHHS